MNENIQKQDLVAILDGYYEESGIGVVHYFTDEESEMLADYLISKNVTIHKHAEWIHIGGDEWACSACGNVISTEGSWEKPTTKYCDECGAKMLGVKFKQKRRWESLTFEDVLKERDGEDNE